MYNFIYYSFRLLQFTCAKFRYVIRWFTLACIFILSLVFQNSRVSSSDSNSSMQQLLDTLSCCPRFSWCYASVQQSWGCGEVSVANLRRWRSESFQTKTFHHLSAAICLNCNVITSFLSRTIGFYPNCKQTADR